MMDDGGDGTYGVDPAALEESRRFAARGGHGVVPQDDPFRMDLADEDWREAARRRAAENGPVNAAAVDAALALADPPPTPTLEGDPGLLTPDEHEAMRLTTDLANLLGRIVGPSTTRQSDLAEVIVPLHVIQRYVMAQAAARAYPAQYRPLGGWFQ